MWLLSICEISLMLICSLFIGHVSSFDHRSSRPEVFCKKGVLRNFTKFTGKHLCLCLIFKVAGLRLDHYYSQNSRSRRLEVLFKSILLKNFSKFTGKYLCQSLFFDEVTELQPATLLKIDSGTGFLI